MLVQGQDALLGLWTRLQALEDLPAQDNRHGTAAKQALAHAWAQTQSTDDGPHPQAYSVQCKFGQRRCMLHMSTNYP